jgi:hypothetical protein
MPEQMRWSVHDRQGNIIHLTQERWDHIIDPINHPEMTDCEHEFKLTLQQGTRKQDPLNPRKYRYNKSFDNLLKDNTHIVAIVLFSFTEKENGELEANNYIVTAYQKEIG